MIENTGKDIGTILKDQREKLGYSLQDAAQNTRIRKTFLESIENNQFADLPGQVYVTGFIKVYARYLDVESAPLLRQLEEVRLSDGPLSVKSLRVVKHQAERFGNSSAGAGWSTFILGLLAVLLLGGAIYLLQPLLQGNTPAGVTSDQVIQEQELVQRPDETPGEAAGTAGEGEQDVLVPLPQEELIPVSEEIQSPERKPLPPVSPDGSLLRMVALSEGSLIIYLDDLKSYRYKLYDGLDLTWQVKKMVKVELAGAGIARFWLDGQALDLDELVSFQLQPATGD